MPPATCSTRSTRILRMQDANHSICSRDPEDPQDAGCQPPHLQPGSRGSSGCRMWQPCLVSHHSGCYLCPACGAHCYARAPRRTQTPTLGLQDPCQDPRSQGLHLSSRGLHLGSRGLHLGSRGLQTPRSISTIRTTVYMSEISRCSESMDVQILGSDLQIGGPDLQIGGSDLQIQGLNLQIQGPDLQIEGPNLRI